LYLSLIDEHRSTPIPLFDLSSIDKELVITLQISKKPHDSSIDEELDVDLSSIDKEPCNIEAPQILDAR